jgi:hypothetical protein
MQLLNAMLLAVLLVGDSCGAAPPAPPADAAAQQKEQEKKDQEKKEQEKKEQQKKEEGKPQEPVPPPDLSPEQVLRERRILSRVLRDLGDGFEGRSPRRVTELLDEQFDDLPRFEDAVTQFLESSAEMRVFLRESTSEVKADKATLIADAQMIYSLKSDPGRELRRRQRIQVDFVRRERGWKIYEIHPREFFEP